VEALRYCFNGIARDKFGNVIEGAVCKVFLAGTETPASIYTVPTGGTSQASVVSASNGWFYFYVDDTEYYQSQKFKIRVESRGYATRNYDSVAIFPVSPITIVSYQPADAEGSDGDILIYEG
jgi:hypothetical protein